MLMASRRKSESKPMPIPALDSLGLLSQGVYDCTLTELREQFGKFQQSDRRPQLFRRLEDLYRNMQRSGLFDSLLIDGSFVTAKAAPNDIDLVAVLRRGHDFERDLPVSEYSLVSRLLLNRRFGFDVIVAENGSALYNTYLEFFGRVRDNPNVRKGLLRLAL